MGKPITLKGVRWNVGPTYKDEITAIQKQTKVAIKHKDPRGNLADTRTLCFGRSKHAVLYKRLI